MDVSGAISRTTGPAQRLVIRDDRSLKQEPRVNHGRNEWPLRHTGI